MKINADNTIMNILINGPETEGMGSIKIHLISSVMIFSKIKVEFITKPTLQAPLEGKKVKI